MPPVLLTASRCGREHPLGHGVPILAEEGAQAQAAASHARVRASGAPRGRHLPPGKPVTGVDQHSGLSCCSCLRLQLADAFLVNGHASAVAAHNACIWILQSSGRRSAEFRSCADLQLTRLPGPRRTWSRSTFSSPCSRTWHRWATKGSSSPRPAAEPSASRPSGTRGPSSF